MNFCFYRQSLDAFTEASFTPDHETGYVGETPPFLSPSEPEGGSYTTGEKGPERPYTLDLEPMSEESDPGSYSHKVRQASAYALR